MKLRVSFNNVLELLLRIFGISMCVVVLGTFLLFLGMLVPSAVDDAVGVFNGHALSSVRFFAGKNGQTVDHIVQERYKKVRWSTYHADDNLTESYVRCEAIRDDGTPITMQWFVRTKVVWEHGFRLKNEVVAAINDEAVKVAPTLIEPGHPIYKSPDMAW